MAVASMTVNMPIGDDVSVSGEAAASGGGEARNYIGPQSRNSTELEPDHSMVDDKSDSFKGESVTEAGNTAVIIDNVSYCVACRCTENRDSALSKQIESIVSLNEHSRWQSGRSVVRDIQEECEGKLKSEEWGEDKIEAERLRQRRDLCTEEKFNTNSTRNLLQSLCRLKEYTVALRVMGVIAGPVQAQPQVSPTQWAQITDESDTESEGVKVSDLDKVREAFDALQEEYKQADYMCKYQESCLKYKEESIVKLKEQVSRLSLSQVDGTSDEPGATGPVQGSVRGAGTSTGDGWSPSRVRAMNSNTIMERTVLASLEPGVEVSRGHFVKLVSDSVGLECLEALGHAGNNSQWHITTRTAAQAKALAETGRTMIGSRKATLSLLKSPGFKIRIFWLPYYVSSDEVKVWLEAFGMVFKDIRHEKSIIKGITHVSTMTREVWVSEARDDICDVLPDVTYAWFGQYRHRVQLAVQGRAAKCHK